MTIERTVQHFTMRPTSRGFLQFYDVPQPPTKGLVVEHLKNRTPRPMHYQPKREMFSHLYAQDDPAGYRSTAAFGTYEWAYILLKGAA